MKALFVGRFQPFHNGHLEVIKNASKKFDEVLIGIGSSQYENTPENPFSADERKQMIKESLEKLGVKNYKIILIPDIHNPPGWVEHVLSIYSDFDVVISNNDFTRELFSEKKISVQETPFYKKDKFSGKEIRSRIASGKQWRELVPKEVYNIIIKINGVERLKQLFKK